MHVFQWRFHGTNVSCLVTHSDIGNGTQEQWVNKLPPPYSDTFQSRGRAITSTKDWRYIHLIIFRCALEDFREVGGIRILSR